MKRKYDDILNSEFIKDENLYSHCFIDYMLDKIQSMFKYEFTDERLIDVPFDIFENWLQTNGNLIFTEYEKQLVFFNGNKGGKLNAYYQPIEYVVNNPNINLSKTYTIDKDCVLVKNDYNELGVLPLLKKYAYLINNAEKSLDLIVVLSRAMMIISASDDTTKASAENFVKKILHGDFDVIGENAFFNGVKVQTGTNLTNAMLTQFIETIQYYKACCYNELGIKANYNMKRERLNTSEISLSTDSVIPFTENMLNCRKKAVEQINKMFDTDIVVDYNSIWKNNDKVIETATDEINDTSTGETDEIENPIEINDTSTGETDETEKDNNVDIDNISDISDNTSDDINELIEKVDDLIESVENIENKKDEEK